MQTEATKSPEGFSAASDILMSPHGEAEETFVRWPRFVGERPKCEEFLLLLPFDAEEGINDSLDLYPSLSFVPWPLYTFPLKKKGKQGC